jgi:hypothetical protein
MRAFRASSTTSATELRVADAPIPREGRTRMASSGKKKTTMAKLNREHRLRERRMEKQARKDARKLRAADPPSAAIDPTPSEGPQQ